MVEMELISDELTENKSQEIKDKAQLSIILKQQIKTFIAFYVKLFYTFLHCCQFPFTCVWIELCGAQSVELKNK